MVKTEPYVTSIHCHKSLLAVVCTVRNKRWPVHPLCCSWQPSDGSSGIWSRTRPGHLILQNRIQGAGCFCSITRFTIDLYGWACPIRAAIWPSSTNSSSNACCVFWIGIQHTSAYSNHTLDLGGYVSDGVFSLFTYVTYEKCYTGNILCKCDIGSTAPCILLYGSNAGGAAASCLRRTDYACITDATRYYGYLYSSRLVA